MRHGTESSYSHHGCRCTPCRTARHEAQVRRGQISGVSGQQGFTRSCATCGRAFREEHEAPAYCDECLGAIAGAVGDAARPFTVAAVNHLLSEAGVLA